MTGQKLIDLIKENKLENEKIYVEYGTLFSGELTFKEVVNVKKRYRMVS